MERGSTKSGPMLDDQRAKEAEPIVNANPPVPAAGEVDARSEIARSLPSSALPGGRRALVAAARQMNATEAVLLALDSLPKDRIFANVQEIWEALGGDPDPQPRR